MQILWRSFPEAREYVRSLSLPGAREYNKYCKEGNVPDDIPASPARVYRAKGWVDWGDFLGTNKKSATKIVKLSFPEAREIVRKLKLKNMKQYHDYWRSGKIPKNIPASPFDVYKKKGWVSAGDWLGY